MIGVHVQALIKTGIKDHNEMIDDVSNTYMNTTKLKIVLSHT